MSDEECATNLADTTGGKVHDFIKVIKEKKLICAGSAPTMHGINSCQVSKNFEIMNSRYN